MARSFVAASTQHLLVSAAPVTAMPLSMACWFKASDTTTSRCLMSISDGAGDNAWYRLNIRGDVGGDPIEANARNGGANDRFVQSTAGYTTSGWYHGCAVFTSTTSRTIYLNGGNSATDTTSGSAPSGMTTTTIGKRSSANSALMNGVISHATIWNVALTASEAAVLARGASPFTVRPASIVGYWFLGFSSPEVDWSKNKNNMTVTGATVVDSAPVGILYPGFQDNFYTGSVAPPATSYPRILLLGVGR